MLEWCWCQQPTSSVCWAWLGTASYGYCSATSPLRTQPSPPFSMQAHHCSPPLSEAPLLLWGTWGDDNVTCDFHALGSRARGELLLSPWLPVCEGLAGGKRAHGQPSWHGCAGSLPCHKQKGVTILSYHRLPPENHNAGIVVMPFITTKRETATITYFTCHKSCSPPFIKVYKLMMLSLAVAGALLLRCCVTYVKAATRPRRHMQRTGPWNPKVICIHVSQGDAWVWTCSSMICTVPLHVCAFYSLRLLWKLDHHTSFGAADKPRGLSLGLGMYLFPAWGRDQTDRGCGVGRGAGNSPLPH